MEQIENLLEARENYLTMLKREKEEALRDVPEGSLRISGSGSRTQYYLRDNPKDFSGKYIRGKDIGLAKKLAQKDYDQKVLNSVEKELNAIKKYNSNYPIINAEEIYESLHRERQRLITPIIETEEDYISKWEKVAYHGKEMDEDTPEICTAKGERVRSKSEVIIADILNAEGIPYRYEYPLKLKGYRQLYPDFTALNVKKRKEIYWEHLGMMDDPNYVENALQKIAIYEQNDIFPGENLILTYETKKMPINQKIVRLMVGRYLR